MHASIIQDTTLVWSKACLIISKPPAIMIIVAILAIVLTLHIQYINLTLQTKTEESHNYQCQTFSTQWGKEQLSVANTVHRKMFVINNFREFCEWSTFANAIILNFYVYTSVHGILEYTNIATSDVTLRWRSSIEALCLVKPSSAQFNKIIERRTRTIDLTHTYALFCFILEELLLELI